MKTFLKLLAFAFLAACLINCSYLKSSQSHSLSTGLSHPEDFYGYGFQGYEKALKNTYIVYKEPKKLIREMDLLGEGVPAFIPSKAKENSARVGPPGTLWTGEKDLWIEKMERSNLEWQEFLRAIKRDSSQAYYLSMVPDVEVIVLQDRDIHQSSHQESEPYQTYFLHPDYLYHPVIGISHYQASEYCKWKTELVTEVYNRFVQKKSKQVRLKFRLPTEAEWERLASPGINLTNYPHALSQTDLAIEIKDEFADYALFKIQKEVSRDQLLADIHTYNQSNPRALVVNCLQEGPYFLQFRIPGPIHWGEPSVLGIHNMIGNVAEMVAEKGIAKGGSWKHSLDESKIKDRIMYSGPNDHVGFRCICELEKMN